MSGLAEARAARRARPPFGLRQLWTWLTVLASLGICVALAWLHFDEQQTLARVERVLDRDQEARNDINKAVVNSLLAGDPSSPYRRELGLALLDQAVSILEEPGNWTAPPPASGLAPPPTEQAFRAQAAQLRALLASWPTQGVPSPTAATELRSTLHQLDLTLERLETERGSELAALSRRQSRRFQFALALAALLLAGACLGVFASYRAQARAAQALQQSEARLRVLGDNLPDSYVLQALRDPQGRLALSHVSAGMARIHGIAVDEVLRDPERLRAQIDPLQQVALDALASARAQDHADLFMELTFKHPDGHEKFLELRAHPLDLPDGRVQWDGIVNDVTAQRETTKRLLDLNRAHAVLSATSQMLARRHEPEEVLATACQIAVEKGEFGMAWVGVVEPGTGKLSIRASAGADPVTLAALERLIAEDPPGGCFFTQEALRAQRSQICEDIALDPRAASWRDAALARGYRSMGAFPLQVPGAGPAIFNLYARESDFFTRGEVALLDELAADISFALELHAREQQRLQAEEARRVSDERFRELAETIEEVFWMVDPHSERVLYVSPAYERVWGRSRAELETSAGAWVESVHPDDRARVHQALSGRRDHGGYDETYRILRPDGSLRWIRDRGYPIRSPDGAVLRLVGTAQDITAQRALEEQFRQAQKMEAIGQLAGGVAHDFNNILAAILLELDLLAETESLSEEGKAIALELRDSARRATGLTRQLLAFSRRQVMEAVDLDLNAVVEEVAKMLRRVIREDVRLELELHPAPLRLHADAGMLDQVLLNLAVNARDAMPQGGTLHIRTALTQLGEAEAARLSGIRPGPCALLEVRDSGSGIASEHLPHIFEPFFTTKEVGKGTGLGLATVFGIVKQHGGAIDVQTALGQGTTFAIHLPLGAAATPARPTARVEASAPGRSELVLLVEDDPSVRSSLQQVLQRHGYRVVTAASGDEARRVAGAHPELQVLITDVVMPGSLDGRALAEKLRATRPGLRTLFISGYNAEMAGRPVALAPGQQFLTKPFSSGDVLRVLRQLLDG